MGIVLCEMDHNLISANANKILDNFVCSEKELKNIKPVRIRYKGNFIITKSGKTIWKRIGDAKNALNLHIESCSIIFFRDKKISWDIRREISKEIKKLIYDKVEFIEVD